ncbi:hypothetical protein PAXINDRAFT_181618 [Paxillus involutus ATCC 200175]|uniref:Uncharacterized protein n=1 Tax=Paxillus involutus ATCC 200175 TaxID=664439 RepID=A0A0C9STU0_PAXIN|nr:hypothetical protein PAXINDRAFT_181618 [Paxillus involutus ATCC 200175]
MHTVGLDIPISISHGIEAIVVLTITEGFVYTVTKMRSVAANAEAKGGRVRPETLTTSFFGRITTRIHTLAMFISPLVYVGVVVFNGFRQPDWMVKFALSDEIVGSEWNNALRVLACSTAFAVRGVANYALAPSSDICSRKVHGQHLNHYTCTPGVKVSRLARAKFGLSYIVVYRTLTRKYTSINAEKSCRSQIEMWRKYANSCSSERSETHHH